MRFAKWSWPQLHVLVILGASLALFGFVWCGPLTGLDWLGWILGAAGIVLVAFVMNFFRDPERPLSGDELDIISPADGKVTDAAVGSMTGTEFVTGRAHMVGIFLNVFDVHVNRTPLTGEVAFTRYKQGKFLDARHPDCGRLNEQQVIGIHATAINGAKIEVRQIAGMIARRIICPLKPGDRLERGQRFGMIKFGSRTELWLDADACDVDWLVKPGDKVIGGQTIIGRIKPKAANRT